METQLRAALAAWLRADPALAAINAVTEEAPLRATPPWLAIAASTSTDWSTKDATGREVRVALELHCRGDDPATAAILVGAIEARVHAMPPAQDGFAIVTTQFMRARAEQRANNTRSVLLEFRFRMLADT
jgi:hypothetical protein